MSKKEDKHARYDYAFDCVYKEFGDALASLELINVALDVGNAYYFSDYRGFFILRRCGSEMVKKARKEIREDLSKIAELAKDIKTYERYDPLKECEITKHNAEILIKLQEVITPYLVAQKLSE